MFNREEKVSSLPSNIEFQIIDIHAKDEEIDENLYVIHLFGVNENCNSVHVKVNGFKPYFYMKLPRFIHKRTLGEFRDYLKDESYYGEKGINKMIIEEKINFQGFSNYKKFRALKIEFNNISSFYQIRKVLRSPVEIGVNGFTPELFESTLPPYLRFLHEKEIRSAGWVNITKFTNCCDSRCQIDIQCDLKNIEFVQKNKVAPLLQASFDIECTSGDGKSFPNFNNKADKVIQIGTTVYRYGSDNLQPIKHIITLKSCDPIEGVIVESYDTEKEVLKAWVKFIHRLDPDIITGYNIYGFDFKYLYERAKLLNIEHIYKKFGKLKGFESELYEKKLSSAALGQNVMNIIPMPGILCIDLLKVVQRDYKLESYKLDNVASEFIKGKIKNIVKGNKSMFIKVNPKEILDLEVGNYIGFKVDKLESFEYNNCHKWKIVKIKEDTLVIKTLLNLPENKKLEWVLKKDDVSPREIFAFQKKGPKKRSIVASYCIMDNILCNKLLDKLKIITNNIGMANVCFVPMSMLFLRGQSIKTYSLVSRQCKKDGYLIPDNNDKNENNEFQGATVLSAQVGSHFAPVSCNDFASLYPSTIISYNLSPDTYITNKNYLEITEYDKFEWDGGKKLYYFKKHEGVDNHDAEYQKSRKGRGIIPRILIKLLQSRKDVKKLMEKEKDPFQKSLLDGLQLSYKLTCNSIYGQTGSSFSPIFCKPVAETCTYKARTLLEFAGNTTKQLFPDAEIVYGDTDSIFVKYNLNAPEKPSPEQKRELLLKSIECAEIVEKEVSQRLPWPHKLEYEKTYYPFILYSKKRYSGVMYEFDVDNYSKVDNKGIVLKRRDNAKIVKYIFGGALDIILFEQDVQKATEFVKKSLKDLCSGKFANELLIISKALKITKTEPAHRTLANRMTKRNPGNAPQLNDRIPYIYIEIDKKKENELLKLSNRKKLLQGDKVEHPDYIKEHNLTPDYLFYITNQIMKPVIQLLSIFEKGDTEKIRNKKVKTKYFDEVIATQKAKVGGYNIISKFFKPA